MDLLVELFCNPLFIGVRCYPPQEQGVSGNTSITYSGPAGLGETAGFLLKRNSSVKGLIISPIMLMEVNIL